MPTFVIITPREVLVILASAFATLNAKVSLCLDQLKLLNSSIVLEAALPRLTEPNSAGPTLAKPSVAIVLRNPPPELVDPLSRKDKLDSLAGHEGLVSVKPSPKGKYWFMATCDKLLGMSHQSCPTCRILVLIIDQKSLGIVRNVPSGTAFVDFEAAFAQLVKATQIGSSRAFWLEFLDQADLDSALNSGFCLGCEFFRVAVYKEMSRCCLQCRSTGHMVVDWPLCLSAIKCSRCRGSYNITKNILLKNKNLS